MNIEAEKLSIIKWLLELKDESLLKRIIDLKAGKTERISIEQYNRELDESEAEVEAGLGVSHEQLKKDIDKW